MVFAVPRGPPDLPRCLSTRIDFKAKLKAAVVGHTRMGTDDLGQDLLARMLYGWPHLARRRRRRHAHGPSRWAPPIGAILGPDRGRGGQRAHAGHRSSSSLFPSSRLLLLIVYLFRNVLTKAAGP